MKKRYNTQSLFFLGDTHFDHEKIMAHDNLPFKSIEDMNNTIIDNIHRVVPRSAILVLVGDVTLFRKGKKDKKKLEDFLIRIDRKIIHVKGNHDDVDMSYVENVLYSCEILNLSIKDSDAPDGRQKISICHYPILSWDCKPYGAWHFHAHTHGGLLETNPEWYRDNPVEDVGAKVQNFIPMSYIDFKKKNALRISKFGKTNVGQSNKKKFSLKSIFSFMK